MNNKTTDSPKTRLSNVQKDLLFVLFSLAERNRPGPHPSMMLFRIMNQGRDRNVAGTNFRRSCHTLTKNGILSKYRDQDSLKLAFCLTPEGMEIARNVYQDRLSELSGPV